MKFYGKVHHCLHCHRHIDERIFKFSTGRFKYPLCIPCQEWYTNKPITTSSEAIELYLSLKLRGVSAELEKFDGYKTVDIAVADAKVNIEVDGPHHHYKCEEALSDLQRTLHVFRKGYLTLRIPTALLNEQLEETANSICDFLKLTKMKILRAI
jgi:very-short-patch-repair endonuclease